MKKIIPILIFFPFICIGQEYFWKKNPSNQNFFDENNWIDTVTGLSAPSFSIEPNQNIDLNLNLTCDSYADHPIKFGLGSITILKGTLVANRIDSGVVNISNLGYLVIRDSIPFINNSQINLLSRLSSIKLHSVVPIDVKNNYLSFVFYNQTPSSLLNNIRLDNYYNEGTVIRLCDSLTKPLTIYSQDSLFGSSADIVINELVSGGLIPNSMNNNISSFLLRKGYMATFAVNEDGTGKSKVFIASEKDLVVNSLVDLKINGISFIRVVPWNWISKKGLCNIHHLDYLMLVDNPNSWWYYDWGGNDSSQLNTEYAPMSWGKGGANDQWVNTYVSKKKVTHVMGFNEPDNCNGQSGQWGDLCVPDTAVLYYKNLMKTGLRLVSPGCREQAWNDWLDTFNILAIQQNTRIDVIAVHWYDWGGNPTNTPNANPQNIFNRFKNYLSNVYSLYNLPIWITEFNGNGNRSDSVNLEFMKLALPYLDTLSYIERYAWFPSNSDWTLIDSMGNLTMEGLYYAEHKSTPSIQKDIYAHRNNLNINDLAIEYESDCNGIVPSDTNFIINSCDSYFWNGTNYTSSGSYTWLGVNVNGGDSTATLNLTINSSSTSISTVTECDSYLWNGITYTSSGTYTWVGTNVNGCDSVANLELIINSVNSSIDQLGDSLYAVTNPMGLNANWYNIQIINDATRVWLMEEDTSTFFPKFDCSYFIIVEDSNGCADTSDIYSYAENAARIGSFTTSPNPTTGLINVKFENPNNQIVKFELISNNSYKIDEFITIENNLTIDLSSYPSGIYYLYFNSEDAVRGCRLEEVQKLSTKIILNK